MTAHGGVLRHAMRPVFKADHAQAGAADSASGHENLPRRECLWWIGKDSLVKRADPGTFRISRKFSNGSEIVRNFQAFPKARSG